MKWDPVLGLWTLFDFHGVRFHGSTPRHAQVWSVAFDIGDAFTSLSVCEDFQYVSFLFWPRNRAHKFTLGKHRMHRKFSFLYSCPCQTGMSLQAGRKKS
jgi:hypothetical protein